MSKITIKIDRKTIKQLLIDEFKAKDVEPPKWLDHMVWTVTEKIKEQLEDEHYKNPWISEWRKKQIIMNIVRDAVSYYIDARDISETLREELKEVRQ